MAPGGHGDEVTRWLRAHLLSVDILPRSAGRRPWATWRPAGESFVYLRAFTTARRTVMLGVLPRGD